MSLYLIESSVSADRQDALKDKLDDFTRRLQNKGELIEVHIGTEAGRAFVIVKADDEQFVRSAAERAGLAPLHVKEVLIVGDDVERIKNRPTDANYLVEWNLPADLTMEKYLARKREKSPLYEQVPEVKFERTYVATDMSKCLCLYDAPDEQFVKKARDVVQAPVDALTTVKRLDA